MFCSKCGGVEEVIKVYERKDGPRLCDVQCLECGEIKYSQAYDFGSRLNLVSFGNKKGKNTKEK